MDFHFVVCLSILNQYSVIGYARNDSLLKLSRYKKLLHLKWLTVIMLSLYVINSLKGGGIVVGWGGCIFVGLFISNNKIVYNYLNVQGCICFVQSLFSFCPEHWSTIHLEPYKELSSLCTFCYNWKK